MVVGWLCTSLGAVAVPGELEALFLRGLLIVGIIMVGLVPPVWRLKHLEAAARFAETEGLYERLDAAQARDLHEVFARLWQVQVALFGLTRDYHIKEDRLRVAEEYQPQAAARSIKAELTALQERLVLEYGVYAPALLSIFRRLEKYGHTPSPELLADFDRGCGTVSDIDAMAQGLHSMMQEVGPYAW